jgi:hypothetical protein
MKSTKHMCVSAVAVFFLGLCLLWGCGGGSMGGSPNATLSSTSLAFGGVAVGTTSPGQSITLSNYGTAALTAVTLAASGPFTQINNCVSTLAVGANCTITVTFTPVNTSDVLGTLSIADNATGSPQIVVLAGSGTVRTGTLTGYCIHGNATPGPPFNACASTPEPTECPIGQPAKNEGLLGCGGNSGPIFVDAASPCVVGSGRHASGGSCEVNP